MSKNDSKTDSKKGPKTDSKNDIKNDLNNDISLNANYRIRESAFQKLTNKSTDPKSVIPKKWLTKNDTKNDPKVIQNMTPKKWFQKNDAVCLMIRKST